MESKSQPSGTAIQELVDSMKELYKTKDHSDVTLNFTKEGINYDIKAHTLIICPRSQVFTNYHVADHMDDSYSGRHYWRIGEWNPSVVDKLMQYLYELDYQVDSQVGTAPALSTHAELWYLGKHLDIKGLMVVASDRYKVALSLFDAYGSEVGFKLSYFEDLVRAVEAVWKSPPDPTGFLRNQISMHFQQNIQEWTKKQGSQSRFLESTYRLIFLKTEQQNQDFKAMMDHIRADYLNYLDMECGP